jgi:RNA polymerase sigma factor (sigma-70 family)
VKCQRHDRPWEDGATNSWRSTQESGWVGACTDAMDGRSQDRAIVQGDFEAWYRREYPTVLGSLLLTLANRDIAEEAAAEAFARAYERWGRVQTMARPRGWVYVVALNVARRRLRRRALERILLMRIRPLAEVPPETGFELWDLVRALSPRERMAIVLRYVVDLPESEVAKVMGISPGGVAKTLHTARSHIASMITDSTIEPRSAQ